MVIISGDLTEWATKAQCQEARSWLDRTPPLLEPHVLLGEDAQRLLLVGGNHDVEYQVRVRRYVRQGKLGWEEHADQLGPFPPGA